MRASAACGRQNAARVFRWQTDKYHTPSGGWRLTWADRAYEIVVTAGLCCSQSKRRLVSIKTARSSRELLLTSVLPEPAVEGPRRQAIIDVFIIGDTARPHPQPFSRGGEGSRPPSPFGRGTEGEGASRVSANAVMSYGNLNNFIQSGSALTEPAHAKAGAQHERFGRLIEVPNSLTAVLVRFSSQNALERPINTAVRHFESSSYPVNA
jgi:hypothetical protein